MFRLREGVRAAKVMVLSLDETDVNQSSALTII